MKIQLTHNYDDIICLENLLEAWKEFAKGKRSKQDVQILQMYLMDNIFVLHDELLHHTYKHSHYQAFKINDPKPRDIHKAIVRDRLLHHAIYRKLYPFFDRTFIADSFSCRLEKGAHKSIDRFRKFSNIVSKNNTKNCWILKCDIRKFFANIDHEILVKILQGYITDKNILWLLEEVISSFSTKRKNNVGLPLGNLTSQLLVNIYMNKFDQFAKHNLKVKYYIRYADDFVIFSEDKKYLENIIPKISDFLEIQLKLKLHPNKVCIKTLFSGVDFLGWINFSDHRVLRTSTKIRMMKRIMENPKQESLNSYLGMLGHGNTRKLQQKLEIAYMDSK